MRHSLTPTTYFFMFRSYCFLKDKGLFRELVTKRNSSSYVQVYYYCEKPICMKCTVTQLARESVGLCPFRGSYVREFELSHTICMWRCLSLALLPFVRKKKANCFTTKFSQAILRNHLGFITTSAIKLCFMQRQGW